MPTLYVPMNVCMCMYACMHVCMYACMYVCMHVCMHACMYVCMYVCMHVCMCMYACMYACMYVCMHACTFRYSCSLQKIIMLICQFPAKRPLFLPRSKVFEAFHQGCQMGYFQTRNPNLGKFWRALQWKRLVYSMAIWNICTYV
jgi:hypothetical protein